MATTSIEWATHVWNPTTGCDRVSPGCDNCYALTMAKRLKGMGSAKYQRDGDPKTSGPGFGVSEHFDTLNDPFGWRKPRRVFVNSMSDLFHDEVSESFIASVFAAMASTPKHTYMILTKRHGRMRSLLNSGYFVAKVWGEVDKRAPGVGAQAVSMWPSMPLPNVWLGVSVEDQKRADLRIPALLETPAAVRWISAEPLLGPIDLLGPLVHPGHRPRLTYWLDGRPGWGPEETTATGLTTQPITVGPRLDWAVVGGESGSGARPMDPTWARSMVEQCQHATVPVFVKQLGSVWAADAAYGVRTVAAVGDRKGGVWSYWPEDLRVREFPKTAVARVILGESETAVTS
ncbi:phage Gp37/Gp68 family protein [Acrocarpospora sp. B8E8]|uniref:DUF5131 family protein n=1 Tax=Acrocarpospora sp. B8E8 TaxID=3153572 RepID=UPI00325D99B2